MAPVEARSPRIANLLHRAEEVARLSLAVASRARAFLVLAKKSRQDAVFNTHVKMFYNGRGLETL